MAVNRQIADDGLMRIAAERDLASRAPGATVCWNEKNNTPTFVTAPVLYASGIVPFAASQSMLASVTSAFLAQNKAITGLNDPANEFQVKSQSTDELGETHVRIQQVYQGVPVWASDAVVHFDAAGNVYCFNGRYNSTPSSIASVEAAVPSSSAEQVAVSDLGRTTHVDPPSSFNAYIPDYTGPQSEKVIFTDRTTGVPALAWHITVRPNLIDRWEYFVDANTGSVIFKYYNTWTDGAATATANDLHGVPQTVHSYQVGSEYYMIDASQPMFNVAGQSTMPNKPVGAIWVIDANNSDATGNLFQVQSANNTWSDSASVSAEFNADQTYNFYHSVFGRNAIDDKGSTIISVIHVTQNGQGLDNAYWNGAEMIYGDGNVDFKPLAGGLDVGAHEMTHGVTQYSCNLVYLDQSGALNESMSDVFGKMVDTSDWLIGATIVKPNIFPNHALRSMADPHNGGTSSNDFYWQPAVMTEYVQLAETQDHGGVHVNSGIPNHAAYLIATAIGRTKTREIYYRAETKYLTSNAQFIDARHALTQAAQDLYGTTEVNAVKSAFDQVQIFDGNGTSTPGDLPAVNGPGYVLVVADNGTLYRVTAVQSPSAGDIQLVSGTQQLFSRPSVTDDGRFAVYVGAANNLYVATVDNLPFQISEIDTNKIWSTCAVSRDGNRLALTVLDTTHPYIYIYDFVSGHWDVDTLYNPTFGQNINSSNVKYASTMDWAPDGDNLVYDNYNFVNSPGGGNAYYYWDIDLINAWNSQQGTFGTRQIQSVLPPAGQGVDIGNPTFSKNTPYIIAFDAINELTGQADVIGANLLTGATGIIASNVGYTVGFPSYSTDDKTIAYATRGVTSVSSTDNIVQWAGVDATKITGTGTVTAFVNSALAPVWYTIGTRPAAVNEPIGVVTQPGLITAYPDPVSGEMNFILSSSVKGSATLDIYNVLGEKVAELNAEGNGNAIPYNAALLGNGMYYAVLRSAQGVSEAHFAVVH
jgi:Zn-dependent metalloprotease